MKKQNSRRKFISKTLVTGTAITLGGSLLYLSQNQQTKSPRPGLKLIKDPKGICDLPKGFKYTTISTYGEIMSDGNKVPDYHDGMGCFEGPNGEIILVRNHEVPLYFPFGNESSPVPELAYDKKSSGGTTTVWLNENLEVTKHYLSLTGTIRNCGGGMTPWGTWISSEEVEDEFGGGWKMGKRHGYNFEVNPLKPLQKAVPLKAMGRFRHEAVAVDSKSGIAYQTEDHYFGCFYRFIPNELERFEKGGVLQALKISNPSINHTSNDSLEINRKYSCQWVTNEEPDPKENTLRLEAKGKGASVFVRGEGIVAHTDGIYFACTAGGKDKVGQFFKYVPNDDNNTGTLSLLFEAKKDGVLEKPDNITINQWGDLIACEDNSLDTKCLVGITPNGKIYYIAANNQSEWAGACFSHDGKILFANIHKDPGMTIAIQGDWEQLRKSK